MSEVKRIAVQYDQICESLKLVECEGGELVKYEDYAALKAERDALTAEVVVKGWIACSPEWIDRNGACSCEAAPRIAFGDIGAHYHPHSFAQATDAYANQLRAEGVEMFENWLRESANIFDANARAEWADKNRVAADKARAFAVNLRKGNGND